MQLLPDLLADHDARADPYGALVGVWLACQDHAVLNAGLDRDGCEQQARALRSWLEADGAAPRPRAAPAATMRALDELCASLAAGNRARRTVNGHHVVLRPTGRPLPAPALGQPGHVAYWLRRHQIVPIQHNGIQVHVDAPPDALGRLQTGFTAFVGGFDDEVLPDWNATSPYVCRRLVDGARRVQSIETALQQACDRHVRIVVLPELTVDVLALQATRAWLRREAHPLAMVVAGSFHIERGEQRWNVATVLDGRGEVVFEHVKLQPMRTTHGEEPIDEGIESGTAVRLLDTRLGLVAVATCLDFCETGTAPVAGLWNVLGPALVLVPSMGGKETNSAHERRASELRREHGTTTLVASQHPEPRERRNGLPAALGLAWTNTPADLEGFPSLVLTIV